MFTPKYLIGIGAVLVVLIGGIIAVSMLNSGGNKALADSIRGVDIPRDMVDGKKMGSDDAPLKLTMYEDFQCPFCLEFTGEDEPIIIDEFVKTGKVQIEYAHFAVLGEESVQAAIASECAADQDLFWEYHKELFALQADEGQDSREVVNDGRFSLSALQGLADKAGLNRSEFDACMNSGEKVETIDEQRSAAQTAGLNGTPNFLINGVPLGAGGGDVGGPDAWRSVLDQLHSAVSGTPVAGPTGTGTTSASPTTGATTSATTAATAAATIAATATATP